MIMLELLFAFTRCLLSDSRCTLIGDGPSTGLDWWIRVTARHLEMYREDIDPMITAAGKAMLQQEQERDREESARRAWVRRMRHEMYGEPL